jgi:hypothetical protein
MDRPSAPDSPSIDMSGRPPKDNSRFLSNADIKLWANNITRTLRSITESKIAMLVLFIVFALIVMLLFNSFHSESVI